MRLTDKMKNDEANIIHRIVKGETSLYEYFLDNTAISATRKKKQDLFVMDNAVLTNISDQQIDDTLNDESEERIGKLNEAIKKLDAEERALISLFYNEEKPIGEIALILGLTESNTKVKLHRIRKKLYILITEAE